MFNRLKRMFIVWSNLKNIGVDKLKYKLWWKFEMMFRGSAIELLEADVERASQVTVLTIVLFTV
jgi:hypothetical protein